MLGLVDAINPATASSLQYDFGIGYGDDIRRAKTLALEAIREAEGVLVDPPPDVLAVGLGDFSVTLRAR